MVYIYAADVSNLPDPKEFPEYMEGLPEERKQKTLRYVQEKDRKQSLGAGLLLKYVLNRHGVKYENIRIRENGKPESDEICFNLSHSDNMAVCAVSEQKIGCDVEKIKNAPERIAERFFCKDEILHLEKFKDEAKNQEFYRLWTMKESYMKMTGEGMSLALNQFEFVFGDFVKVVRDGKICSCFIKEYELPEYKLTVCAEEAEFAENIEYIKLEKYVKMEGF